MIQSTDSGFFLIQEEFLQFQLDLGTGNGTFHATRTQTNDAINQQRRLAHATVAMASTYSLCLSPYSEVEAAAAPAVVSPAPRVFAVPVFASAPALAAALPPAVPVVACKATTKKRA